MITAVVVALSSVVTVIWYSVTAVEWGRVRIAVERHAARIPSMGGTTCHPGDSVSIQVAANGVLPMENAQITVWPRVDPQSRC